MSARVIQALAVVGAGQMGGGIAQVAATAGLQVSLIDRSKEQLVKTTRIIQSSLEKLASKGKLVESVGDITARLQATTEMEVGPSSHAMLSPKINFVTPLLPIFVFELGFDIILATTVQAVSSSDCVIEAVPEVESLKASIFKAADQMAPPHAILATNTSSISITRLAATTQRPDQFIGIHFMNPGVSAPPCLCPRHVLALCCIITSR